jgi:hypothetical protein
VITLNKGYLNKSLQALHRDLNTERRRIVKGTLVTDTGTMTTAQFYVLPVECVYDMKHRIDCRLAAIGPIKKMIATGHLSLRFGFNGVLIMKLLMCSTLH